jgi:hypothetical protein
VLKTIGDAVPAGIELGYHLCYGSPADEHCVQPKDAGIMVEMTNAIVAGVKRPIQFFHLPVPKGRTDDAYYAPLEILKLGPETELYLGLIHHGDAEASRRAASRARRRHRHRVWHGARRSRTPARYARRTRPRRRNRTLGGCPSQAGCSTPAFVHVKGAPGIREIARRACRR